MPNQIELFSPALGHLQQALDAMQTFSLAEAKEQLEIAYEIDPYLANVKTLMQTVECLLHHDINPRTKAPALAKAWQKIQTTEEPLAPTVFRILEAHICERILQLLPADYCDFVDTDKSTIHIGYCYLALNRFEEAHKKLLDYLTRQHEDQTGSDSTRACLWGYFGDASYRLLQHDECNGGYLQALLTDALSVDLKRLQHAGLRQVFKRLSREYPDETARALLPIHAWLEGLLYIPKRAIWLSRLIRNKRFDHSTKLLSDPVKRYRQFALCLYIDQAGLHNAIDFEARVEMQRLDGGLFRAYLDKVG